MKFDNTKHKAKRDKAKDDIENATSVTQKVNAIIEYLNLKD